MPLAPPAFTPKWASYSDFPNIVLMDLNAALGAVNHEDVLSF